MDFCRVRAVDSAWISFRCPRCNEEGRVVTRAIPARTRSETDDEFAWIGLGGSLALSGILAAVKIAETATGVVLTATGVLPGAHHERAPETPGGE